MDVVPDDDLDPVWAALIATLSERVAERGLLAWTLDQLSDEDRGQVERAWALHVSGRLHRQDQIARGEWQEQQ